MILLRRCALLLCYSILFSFTLSADWRDKTELLIYSPRYFGPNAFPIPELRSGLVGSRFEAEVRGEYHYYSGDKTKDLYGRLFLPIVRGRAAIEVSFVYKEDYKMTPETRDERNAVDVTSPISYNGDIVVSGLFQLLKSEKWVDAMFSFNLKTASGGRLCDARFTDAAAYWFDLTLGKNLYQSTNQQFTLRMQGLVGFYCWMTNDMVHRQNDAISYGIGLTGIYRHFTLTSDLSGFHGYEKNGDRPMTLRNHLSYEIKKNIISFRYNHGMKDRLYDTYSLAYIRCF
ncbi:hypothetical protein [Parabacteroides sp. PF5-9]|uniref:hypothetical protein n=1 Tax=Parabacteroides sp. PF5-9 TaxID=1742404 RepID=UPI002472FF89|nr:hypothetical protein [Parabacteroides sp. PF5-9]MDH6358876.1 hypothetical protein [Parabacteroides sp. PF5-9]